MLDPTTERRYADCRELMDLWRRYHDFFKIAVAGKEITPEREHEFITVKSRIAMLHDSFMDCLEHDQNIGQNVLSIVTRSITLKHVHRMSTAEIKKIELEWHESYLLLNETIGILEDKRRQFSEIKHSDYVRQQMMKKATMNLKQFLGSWVFKTLVVMVVLVVGIFVAMELQVMQKLFEYGPTRSIIIKWEDLIRGVFKDYPYRDLTVFTRKDKMQSPGVEFTDLEAQKRKAFSMEAGIRRATQKVAGSNWDFSQELTKGNIAEYRAEIYTPGGMLGGDPCHVWIFRMNTTKIAKSIATKYMDWAKEKTRPDWAVIRRSNVLVIAFGGDREGEMFRWLRKQYGRGEGN